MTQPAKTAGVLTVASYCKDCHESWEGRNAPYDAIAHHEQTGHHIRVEQTIFWERKSVRSFQSPVRSPQPLASR